MLREYHGLRNSALEPMKVVRDKPSAPRHDTRLGTDLKVVSPPQPG